MRQLVILEEDKQWARSRVTELDQIIQNLGPEFYDVFNQSSETWHDNAPFDALRDRQSVLDAERQQLRSVLRDSLPAVPKSRKGKIGYGAVVTLEKAGQTRRYQIRGDWTPHAGQAVNGVIVVSAQSPLGTEVIGKRVGDEISFGKILTVE